MMCLAQIRTHALRSVGWTVLSLLALAPFSVHAQMETPGRSGDLGTLWSIDDASPGKHIPTREERNKHPLQFGYWLQDMLARAEGARERGDWAGAVKYDEVLKKALPEQGKPYSRLCGAYYHLGQADQALPNCMTALSKRGAIVYDHLRFVDLMLQKPSLRPEQIQAVEASLKHLREHATTHPQALPGEEPKPAKVERADDMTPQERKADPEKWRRLKLQEILQSAAGEPEPTTSGDEMHLPTQIEIFRCKLGVRTGDAPLLSECTGQLARYNFPRQLLIPFKWAEALAKRDEAAADRVLKAARELGLPQAAIGKMEEEQARRLHGATAGARAGLPGWAPSAAAGILLLGLVAAAFARRRARRSGAAAT